MSRTVALAVDQLEIEDSLAASHLPFDDPVHGAAVGDLFGAARLAAGVAGDHGPAVTDEMPSLLHFGQMVEVADTDGHFDEMNGHWPLHAGDMEFKPDADSMSGDGLQGALITRLWRSRKK